MAKNRSYTGLVVLSLVVIALGVAASYFWKKSSIKPPEVMTASVSRGDLMQAVTATGVMESPTSVDVSSQISGLINELLVDYNQHVKKNDVLARIDPASYQSRLQQAQASYASAKATATLSRLNAERTRELKSKSLVSQQDLDSAEAQLAQADAAVLTAKASVDDAQVNLDRCTIFSPIDGIVLDRQCDVGKTVAASLNAPTLFTIVSDLSKMQINTDVAEADVGSVKEGQEVNFTVDAYPGRTFHGRVTQVRNMPKTSQSVVVYSTIITVDNSDLKLKPGMTANVSIVVARRTGVLKVANAVLRARVPDKFLPATATNAPAPSASATGAPAAPARPSGENGGDRRAQFRQLLQDAGVTFTPGQPLSAADREKLAKLAAERGIELPEHFGSGRGRGEAAVTARTVYRVVEPAPALKIEPVSAKFGISDGTSTEVVDGLGEGDVLVSSIFIPGETPAAQAQNRNPFGGQSGPGAPGMGPRRF